MTDIQDKLVDASAMLSQLSDEVLKTYLNGDKKFDAGNWSCYDGCRANDYKVDLALLVDRY